VGTQRLREPQLPSLGQDNHGCNGNANHTGTNRPGCGSTHPTADRQPPSTAIAIARRFTRRGETFEDLYQVASLGLILTVDRYDTNKSATFVSFAIPTIMGEVRRH
jgi:hypothetical protein